MKNELLDFTMAFSILIRPASSGSGPFTLIKSFGYTLIVFLAAATPSLLNAAIAVTSFAVEPGCVACVNPISVFTFQPGSLLSSFCGSVSFSQSFTGGSGQQAEASTSPVL